MKRNVLLLIGVFMAHILPAQEKGKQAPNIIIIMADDLGYSDIGCYGGEINTPNIDRLAKNGLRMTNFYNNARCCPTRASLLTGQYAHKVGLAQNGNALTRNGATIAELLKENGYQTGMVGKWHLSDDVQRPTKEAQLKWLDHQAYLDSPFASLESYPINRGFQKHYGVIWGVVDYFDPFSLVDGEKPVKEVPDTATINKELGWAEGLGLNVMRVYLHHLLWTADKEGFKKRLNTYLSISSRHGNSSIKVCRCCRKYFNGPGK